MAKLKTSHDFLSDLPVEILRLVTAPLARKELKALRTTNRKLLSIASETMFQSIALTTNCASYIQLLYIVASTMWSAQVRHIDWVLLHATGNQDSLTQKMKFNEPWVTMLQKWRVYEVASSGYESGNVYPGLSLQCRLVQRLPNVQTVRFWSAVNSQRIGREPWENGNDENDAIETTRAPGVSQAAFYDMPSPEDIFSILKLSGLKSQLIKTVAVTMYLRFSTSKEILKGVQILPHQSGELRHDSLKHYRGASNHDEKRFSSRSMDCFDSLANSGISSLTVIRVSGVQIFRRELKTLLTANVKLRYLYLSQVELCGFHDPSPMVDLLFVLQGSHNRGSLHNLKVTIQKLRCQNYSGHFSATEQELQDWMKGKNHELLNTVSSAFVHIYPESTAGPNLSSDEDEKAKLELDDIKDMDSEDEEIEFFNVGRNLHQEFDRSRDTEEYKNMVGAIERTMGLQYDPTATPQVLLRTCVRAFRLDHHYLRSSEALWASNGSSINQSTASSYKLIQ
ncbi:hypothetical protein MMC14_001541 [Varicellaria rhodocarpa]|nr:hypothetical protein [Varicellaria rhodocarpa]